MGQNNIRKSGFAWSKQLGINILELGRGWKDAAEFNDLLLDLETFMNLAGQCKVEQVKGNLSRREAANLKRELLKKLN